MRKASFCLYLFISLFVIACSGRPNESEQIETIQQVEEPQFNSFEERISYCIGLDNGFTVNQVYNGQNTTGKFSMSDIEEGLVDYLGGEDLRISIFSIDSILQLYLGENGEINETIVSKADASYAIGLVEGQTLVGSLVGRGIDQRMEIESLQKGIKNGLHNNMQSVSLSEARSEVSKYYSEMNLTLGKSFLDNNAKNENVITTESGLQYEIITEGSGITPNITDTVVVHYTARFIDGRVFESTVPAQKPVAFTPMGVIQGFQEGLLSMKEGESKRLFIPYELAYGEQGSGPVEPYSTLVFDIELLRVNRFHP